MPLNDRVTSDSHLAFFESPLQRFRYLRTVETYGSIAKVYLTLPALTRQLCIADIYG